MKNNLRKTDIEHIWHPYTNMDQFKDIEFPIIKKAKGLFLYTTDGQNFTMESLPGGA